ncbi:uncharacterized protein EMH_0068350 [Eimeria mitis]|uniref:TPR domain-containing protein n=1 Tax=Eimeria mitis TaxID=44415 RepID=U6KFF3_9EIME|nr:uncharacterized protein EMH_0068350 [Eimeria mitis]CDJ36679.1 hypothetical protein, conserved [Eimeria mitis]
MSSPGAPGGPLHEVPQEDRVVLWLPKASIDKKGAVSSSSSSRSSSGSSSRSSNSGTTDGSGSNSGSDRGRTTGLLLRITSSSSSSVNTSIGSSSINSKTGSSCIRNTPTPAAATAAPSASSISSNSNRSTSVSSTSSTTNGSINDGSSSSSIKSSSDSSSMNSNSIKSSSSSSSKSSSSSSSNSRKSVCNAGGEAALAAEAFHAAGSCSMEAKALRLYAQAERNLRRHKQAGKAMQRLGDLLMKEKKAARRGSSSSSSNGSAGGAAAAAYEEAMKCYDEAVYLYKAAGDTTSAVSLLLQVAARRGRDKNPKGIALCADAYEEALRLLAARHELQQTDEALRSSFLGSPEFAAGAAAVDAARAGDNERLAAALESPVFRLLLPPVAALAAKRAAAARSCSGGDNVMEREEIGFSGEAVDMLLMSDTQTLNPRL